MTETATRPAVTGPAARKPGAALPRAGLAGLLAFAPVVALAPAYGRTGVEALTEPAYALPMLGAVALAPLTCLLVTAASGEARRVPPVTRLTIALAALAGYVLLIFGRSPAELAAGPFRLLTSIPPLDPDGAELAACTLFAGLVAIGTVEPALRRTAAGWSLIAPVLGTGIAVLLAVPGRPATWLAPAFVTVTVGLLAMTARERRPVSAASAGFRLLPPVALLALAAIGAIGGLLATPLLTLAGDPEPVDLRLLADQTVQPREGTSPLAQYPALRSGKLTLRLTVRSAQPSTRLRFATLDRFDGTYWTSAATYRRAGTRLPAPDRDGVTVEDEVHVEDPGTFGWLVATGRPVQVSETGLGVDTQTGDVVMPAGRPVPRQYTVRSLVTEPDPAALAGDIPAAYTGERPPATLVGHATRLAGANGGYPALRRLADQLAFDGGFSVSSSNRPPTGHGLFQIDRLLTSHSGTAEQYASAYALMARALGYDARVVVGFRPSTPGKITERDVDAWAEVRFAGAGWVGFYPTPGSRQRAPEPQPAEQDEPVEPAPTTTPAPLTAPSGDSTVDSSATGGPAAGNGPQWIIAGLAAGVAVMLLAARPVSRGLVRRRRRTAPDPRRRIYGAWLDALDRYADAGLAWPPSTTSGQVAAAAAERFPAVGEPTRRLARLADAAGYAAAQPTAGDADHAWTLNGVVRGELAKATPWWLQLLPRLTKGPERRQ
ncbi:DUF3488 and transglutaminase-like domain-containing protein [Dactylosporangium sp. CA-152071]|uniref:DUF3488 and transglutaminase-like domain-containing protein n=1 Tax=Dactylosporangium sp. CA-152071 TaxID=3239933 RepID=UPI003D8A8D45